MKTFRGFVLVVPILLALVALSVFLSQTEIAKKRIVIYPCRYTGTDWGGSEDNEFYETFKKVKGDYDHLVDFDEIRLCCASNKPPGLKVTCEEGPKIEEYIGDYSEASMRDFLERMLQV